MPRSPTRTSTGSPGTSRMATKVTNISAKKVGIVSASRRQRNLSMEIRRPGSNRAVTVARETYRLPDVGTGEQEPAATVELVHAHRAVALLAIFGEAHAAGHRREGIDRLQRR